MSMYLEEIEKYRPKSALNPEQWKLADEMTQEKFDLFKGCLNYLEDIDDGLSYDAENIPYQKAVSADESKLPSVSIESFPLPKIVWSSPDDTKKVFWTDVAKSGGARMGEAAEKLLFDGFEEEGKVLYGLRTHPSRYTMINGRPAEAVALLGDNKFHGPYTWLCRDTTTFRKRFDYKCAAVSSDALPKNEAILLNTTQATLRIVRVLRPCLIFKDGKFQTVCIHAPQLRTDTLHNLGVVHFTFEE